MDSLPVELLCRIIGYITEQKDRKSLCEVSKGFNTCATPFLYNSITLNAAESDLGFYFKAFLKDLLEPSQSRLRNVRHLHIVSPFRQRLDSRCLHWYNNTSGRNDEGRSKQPEKSIHWELEPALISVLHQLEENTLLSFSWDLGICIPSTLLGQNGILTKKQRLIQSLSLTTGGIKQSKCYYHPAPLLQLGCLRKLSWKAINTVQHFSALHDGLLLNSQHLDILDIDLVDYRSVDYIWRDKKLENPEFGFWQALKTPFRDNFFAILVLDLTPSEPLIILPFLQQLRLSEVSFSYAAMEIACALNMTNLRSLKLHNCRDYLELLNSVTKAPRPMRLTSFELVTNEYQQDSFLLSNFLEAFAGLEELYLLLYDCEWLLKKDYWPSIEHHKSTLKRLVYHKETRHLSIRSVLSYNITQNCSLRGSVDAITVLPLVDCIGISDCGYYLESRLEMIAPELIWKLLHIRWSHADEPHWCGRRGDDTSKSFARNTTAGSSYTLWRPMSQYVPQNLHNFATWAFGLTGLLKLRILASGDFSHKGRFDENNVLLCRRSPVLLSIDTDSEPEEAPELSTESEKSKTALPRQSYRVMRKEDWGLWEGIEGGFAMLEACPFAPLMD